MNLQKGTFNTIAQGSAEFGGHFPVWSRVRELYQGGGVIDCAEYPAGTVIGAGTPVQFMGAGKTVTVLAGPAYKGKAYEVGDIVEYEGKIYKSHTKIGSSVPFESSSWDDITDTVNGLIFEDVCIPEGCTSATCAVVRAGRIYADRVVGASIPTAMESHLPMIEFVREI